MIRLFVQFDTLTANYAIACEWQFLHKIILTKVLIISFSLIFFYKKLNKTSWPDFLTLVLVVNVLKVGE